MYVVIIKSQLRRKVKYEITWYNKYIHLARFVQLSKFIITDPVILEKQVYNYIIPETRLNDYLLLISKCLLREIMLLTNECSHHHFFIFTNTWSNSYVPNIYWTILFYYHILQNVGNKMSIYTRIYIYVCVCFILIQCTSQKDWINPWKLPKMAAT